MTHLQTTSSGPSPDVIRLWAKFFSTVDQSLPTVTVLTQWMNFFTMLLLKQSSFAWAKEFLQSSAWHAISQTDTGIVYSFTLPPSKPTVSITEISCTSSGDASSPLVVTDSLCSEPEDAGFTVDTCPLAPPPVVIEEFVPIRLPLHLRLVSRLFQESSVVSALPSLKPIFIEVIDSMMSIKASNHKFAEIEIAWAALLTHLFYLHL
jgi:hypothetical protein